MPRQAPHPRPERFADVASIASSSLLEFLVPALASQTKCPDPLQKRRRGHHAATIKASKHELSDFFFASLARISECPRHRNPWPRGVTALNSAQPLRSPRRQPLHDSFSKSTRIPRHDRLLSTSASCNAQPHNAEGGRSTMHSRLSVPTLRDIFDVEAKGMKTASHLPKDFFDDVFEMQLRLNDWPPDKAHPNFTNPISSNGFSESRTDTHSEGASVGIPEQLRLLKSVRELEEKLGEAKQQLEASLRSAEIQRSDTKGMSRKPLTLTKEDYLGLVDLYYYSHHDRFHPEGKDYSPSPVFLEDYSFKLSSKFNNPYAVRDDDVAAEDYESPLKEIERALLNNKMREVQVMQDFVDLLLDDRSSNRRLYHAYQRLPKPGVAHLPKGVIRLFLQRMSTPWVRSEGAMVRYLTLMDEMQEAKIPITQAEWSSAIFLAARSLSKVTTEDVSTAMGLWRKMEHQAGVRATHVTFNILFDIAVRAGKHNLAESIMKEMWERDLRLNRLGRVSLIFYHGIRSDGDAVRQTYRDFIDAGEIVDTLVLNCVIASLLRSQEPTAAEQIFERMKDLQKRLASGKRPDGSETFYIRYPAPSSAVIGREVASNSLGRILLNAPRLKKVLPEHHTELQDIMPMRPDHVTFRSLIAYHANVSGDLDRITVLLKEMMDDFDLPMRNSLYTLIFKGFALHARPNNGHEKWTTSRLDQVWDTCRGLIKHNTKTKSDYDSTSASEGDEDHGPLPRLSEIEAAKRGVDSIDEIPNIVGQKRLDPWSDFVLDLAAFPYQRRKPIERIHAELFDEEPAKTTGFMNNFFASEMSDTQQTFYAIGNQEVDREEGEYILPSPAQAAMGQHYRPGLERAMSRDGLSGATEAAEDEHNRPFANLDDFSREFQGQEKQRSFPKRHRSIETDEGQNPPSSSSDATPLDISSEGHLLYDNESSQQNQDAITGDRPMFCWLLRAYSRATCSRDRLEEVYNSIRKVWIPTSTKDRIGFIRVLARCQKDCDKYGGYKGSHYS
jgi:pentatricopeptide repeat protein